MAQIFTCNNSIQVLLESQDLKVELNGTSYYMPEPQAVISQNQIASGKDLFKVLGRNVATSSTVTANSIETRIKVRVFQAVASASALVSKSVNIFRRPLTQFIIPLKHFSIGRTLSASGTLEPVASKHPKLFRAAGATASVIAQKITHFTRQAGATLAGSVSKKAQKIFAALPAYLTPFKYRTITKALTTSAETAAVIYKHPRLVRLAAATASASISKTAHLVRAAGATVNAAVSKAVQLVLQTLPQYLKPIASKSVNKAFSVSSSLSATVSKHANAVFSAAGTMTAAGYKQAIVTSKAVQALAATVSKSVYKNAAVIMKATGSSIVSAIYAAANFFNIPALWVVTYIGFTKVARQVFTRKSNQVVVTTAKTSNVVLQTANTSAVVIPPEYPN